MKIMDCEKSLEMLQLKIDNELTPVEEADLIEHISSCSICRERYQSENLFKDFLRKNLPKKSASDTLKRDICIQIDNHTV